MRHIENFLILLREKHNLKMTIDTLYEDVINQLTNLGLNADISVRLISLKTNDERVLYAQALVERLHLLPEPVRVCKSERVSTHYRNLGNQHFQQSQDYMAWQYYNLSLLHAPPTSDTYSVAIANRSAVLCSLNKYSECMVDIEKVFSMKYPEKLRKKLLKRQSFCRENLSKQEPDDYVKHKSRIDELLDMRVAPHISYQCASSKLEVVYNKNFGRHVIATADIFPGEVLVKEKPYFTLLLKSQCLFSCSYCLSRNANLYPCHSCCFAMYCSTECRKKAWKDYHIVECPMVPSLVDMDFTKLELLSLRTVIKARTEHASWDDLYKTIDDTELRKGTAFHGFVREDDEWKYHSHRYPAIHALATNLKSRSISDLFQKSVTAVAFLHLLKQLTDFLKCPDPIEADEVYKFVAGLLLHHLMTSPTNMHSISSNNENSEGNYVDEVSLASAPYAFLSLLNHSCTPNVVRFSKLGTGEVTLFALRPIKRGMAIYDNYG